MILHNGAVTCRGVGGRLITLLAVVWSLGACTASTAFREHLYPKPPPAPGAILSDYAAFNSTLKTIREVSGTNADDDVRAYVTSGYDLAEKACLDFFTKVRQLRNDTSFAKDAMRNVMASAGLISALATAPTSVLAGLFGATGVAPSIVDDFERTFLFADASDSLYPQIFTVMRKYRIKFPAAAANVYTADMRVRQHATVCSLPYLTYVVKTGVKEVKIGISDEKPGEKPGDKPSAVPLGAMEIK
jgi:hypothetical protein